MKKVQTFKIRRYLETLLNLLVDRLILSVPCQHWETRIKSWNQLSSRKNWEFFGSYVGVGKEVPDRNVGVDVKNDFNGKNIYYRMSFYILWGPITINEQYFERFDFLAQPHSPYSVLNLFRNCIISEVRGCIK